MIKYLYKLLMVWTFTLSCSLVIGQTQFYDSTWINSLDSPWELPEEELNSILKQFQNRYSEFDDRFEAFLWWRIGTPYGIFKFGEEKLPDDDPLIRMDSSDCTSHILCNIAISQSNSWDEARRNMVRLHYKAGDGIDPTPEYTQRWHYTLDRILHNPVTVNLTDSLFSKDLLEEQTLTLNRKSDGTEFLPLSWSAETKFRYLPAESVNEKILEALPDLVGVAFVKRSYFKMGIAIAHEGVLLDQRTLIHASSDSDKTSAVNFFEYFHRNDGPLFDGIMVYKFVPFLKINKKEKSNDYK